jgi:hypothetical protein
MMAARPGRRPLRVLGVAAALIVVLAGAIALGDNRLRAAREDDAEEVLAAVQRGDCAAAAAAHDGATTGTTLPGRRPAVSADVGRAAKDCRDLAKIDAVAASGQHVKAIRDYVEFRRVHVFSPLYKQVPHRIRDIVNAGKLGSDRDSCDVVSLVLGDNLPGKVVDALPALLASCAQLYAETAGPADGDYFAAYTMLETLRKEYGQSAEARRAEALEASLRVKTGPTSNRVRTPPRVGGGSKLAEVRYVNHGPGTMVLSMSGPRGGRVVEVKGCADCPRLESRSAGSCDNHGAASADISLPPGTYRVKLEYIDSDGAYAWTGSWKLRAGQYAQCLAPATGSK